MDANIIPIDPKARLEQLNLATKKLEEGARPDSPMPRAIRVRNAQPPDRRKKSRRRSKDSVAEPEPEQDSGPTQGAVW